MAALAADLGVRRTTVRLGVLMAAPSWSRLALITMLTVPGCGGLCEDDERASVVSPDGRSTVRVFIRNCGATTPFITVAEVRFTRSWFPHRELVYVEEGTEDLVPVWETPERLVIECAGCPARGLLTNRWNDVVVSLRQTYTRPSQRTDQ